MITLLSGTTNIPLAKKVALLLKARFLLIDKKKFSDGESYVRIPSLRGDVVFLHSGLPEPDSGFIELLLSLDAVFRLHPRSVNVVFSFFPYRRQERQEYFGEAVGAAMIARCLSSFPVDRFFCVQPHTEKMKRFFSRPFLTIPTLPIFIEHFKSLSENSEWVVVAPDEGSAELSQRLARALQLPYVLMHKKRDTHDHVATIALSQGKIAQKNAILIDDEISTGGTILKNVAVLKKYGIRKIVVAATHPVFSGNASKKLQQSSIDRIIVSDTIHFAQSKKFTKLAQCSVAPLITEALAFLKK